MHAHAAPMLTSRAGPVLPARLVIAAATARPRGAAHSSPPPERRPNGHRQEAESHGGDAASCSLESLTGLLKAELQARAKAAGLATSGTKVQLAQRLLGQVSLQVCG